MHKILSYLINNIRFILLAISLVSGAIVPIKYGVYIYYAGLCYILYFNLKNKNNNWYIGRYFILFIIACILSCVASGTYNYRLFAFTAIIISFTPITISNKLFLFRKKYLKHCLMIFPILSIISLFCYIYGINYYKVTGNKLDFSAIFPHPMWMGVAIGLSNIVTIWLLLSAKKRIIQTLYFAILLLSIYITVVSGSRSALFASLISMVIYLIIKLRKVKRIIIAGCVITILISLLLPIYMTGAKRMINKFDNNKGEYGSRAELFTTGFKHVKESPIFGVGFAVSYNTKGEKILGRLESGSGWLSILFQTGIIGFSVIIIIMFKLYKNFLYIRKDNDLLLFTVAFLYISLHSIFEGYILTVGYYPCILFWCLLGYLYTYPYYIEKYTLLKGIRKIEQT